MVTEHARKVKKVQLFLLTCIYRARFKKTRHSVGLLQRFVKGQQVRKNTKKMVRAKRDQERVADINLRIHKASPEQLEKMERSAAKIQHGIYLKLKRKREGKAIRVQISKLPMICRSGFVKMLALKANTNQL